MPHLELLEIGMRRRCLLLARHLKSHPTSGRGWFNLGYAQLELGDANAGAKAFMKAYELDFRKATSAYNVTCSFARANEVDQAFTWLTRATDEGFDNDWHLANDPDLDSLRDDSRFPKVDFAGGHWQKLKHHIKRELRRHFGDLEDLEDLDDIESLQELEELLEGLDDKDIQ